jgi:hypothetical protein
MEIPQDSFTVIQNTSPITLEKKHSSDFVEITLFWESVTILKKNKNSVVIGCEKFKCKFLVENRKLLYKICKHSFDAHHSSAIKLSDQDEFVLDSSPKFKIPSPGQ